MKKGLLVFLAAFLVIASCSKGGSDDGSGGGTGGGGGGGVSVNCAGVASAFAANVKPIIQSMCATDATCHGAGSVSGTSGPGPLQTYDQIFNARVTIRSAVSSGFMPKTGTLTTVQKNTIICWIDSGAPNN